MFFPLSSVLLTVVLFILLVLIFTIALFLSSIFSSLKYFFCHHSSLHCSTIYAHCSSLYDLSFFLVVTTTLIDSLYSHVHHIQVHRLVIVDENNHVEGILSLSDILKYIILKPMGKLIWLYHLQVIFRI